MNSFLRAGTCKQAPTAHQQQVQRDSKYPFAVAKCCNADLMPVGALPEVRLHWYCFVQSCGHLLPALKSLFCSVKHSEREARGDDWALGTGKTVEYSTVNHYSTFNARVLSCLTDGRPRGTTCTARNVRAFS